ncbi:hypothetical protein HY218_01680 [Candidatus Saccharibacteria bacterium]|nr:hypothetical protein [Candidatus Saccharibacteria bacterium]
MSEQYPVNRWEIGTEAAWAYNEAFDQRAQAEQHLSQLTSAASIEGVTVDVDVRHRVEADFRTAEQDFEDYSDVVNLMIGRDVSYEEVERPAPIERLSNFLDASERLSLPEELETMTRFWDVLGYKVPDISQDMAAALAREIGESPNKRVVPAPVIVNPDQLKALTAKAKDVFADNKFSETYDPQYVTDESYVFGRLLRNPDGFDEADGKRYELVARDQNGNLQRGLNNWRIAMSVQSAMGTRLVMGENGQAWTFAIVSAEPNAARTRKQPGELFNEVDQRVTPSTLIAVNLLHQANGTPNTDWNIDFANLAVAEVEAGKKGKKDQLKVVRVASVYWHPYDRYLELSNWNAGNSADDNVGVR